MSDARSRDTACGAPCMDCPYYDGCDDDFYCKEFEDWFMTQPADKWKAEEESDER